MRTDWRKWRTPEDSSAPSVEDRNAKARAEFQAELESQAEFAEKEARKARTRLTGKRKRSEAWLAENWCERGYKVYAQEFFANQIHGHLTPAEQKVFSLIFMRTVWFLKQWEVIRLSQFTDGSMPRDDGTRLFWGTGLSRRTVRDTLKALVADGLVLRRDKAGGNGLQEYALPRVDEFRDLPRFAGKNIGFSAPIYDAQGRYQTLTI
jgi:hypothetical protein